VGDSKHIVGSPEYVVPPNDAEAFFLVLCGVIDLGNARRREIGLANRKRVLDHFSIETAVEKYEKVYCNLLHANGD